mgnify:CR=1 FL=1
MAGADRIPTIGESPIPRFSNIDNNKTAKAVVERAAEEAGWCVERNFPRRDYEIDFDEVGALNASKGADSDEYDDNHHRGQNDIPALEMFGESIAIVTMLRRMTTFSKTRVQC